MLGLGRGFFSGVWDGSWFWRWWFDWGKSRGFDAGAIRFWWARVGGFGGLGFEGLAARVGGSWLGAGGLGRGFRLWVCISVWVSAAFCRKVGGGFCLFF